MKKLLFPLLITTTLITPNVLAGTFTDNIKLAMVSESRTDKDKDRDRNRKPAETLEFFGIKSDMKVLEIIPGGGCGVFQDSCHHFINFYAATSISRTGFNVTGPSASQFCTSPDHRSGFFSLAASNINFRLAKIAPSIP